MVLLDPEFLGQVLIFEPLLQLQENEILDIGRLQIYS